MKANTASSVVPTMPAMAWPSAQRRQRLGQAPDEVGLHRHADEDQHEEPADLDHRHDAGEAHRCVDAPGGDGAHRHDHPGDEHGLRQGQEYADVAGAAEADGGGRDDGDGNHQQADARGQLRRIGRPP